MRYLGNKTRLIEFITKAIDGLGIEPGVACDPFAGTASVAAALKTRGWRVHAGDLMATSYALQVARIELDEPPTFDASLLRGRRNGSAPASLHEIADFLGALEGEPGFLTEHFTPEGKSGRRHGRMYFTPANGRRLDAIRGRIDDWRVSGQIDALRAQTLIAALIEAADRVANTTGVYASFVKTWQPNARRPLRLDPVLPAAPPNGPSGCTAFRGPAVECLRGLGPIDLLYLDPPYNGRQYPAYYHIPELIALGWSDPPDLRGKTGLIPDEGRRSDWCRKNRAEAALHRVLDAADARHVLFSYNDEGLLERETIAEALRQRGDPDSYRLLTRPYRRYRSDADGPRRNYRRDRVREHLHYVRCERAGAQPS